MNETAPQSTHLERRWKAYAAVATALVLTITIVDRLWPPTYRILTSDLRIPPRATEAEVDTLRRLVEDLHLENEALKSYVLATNRDEKLHAIINYRTAHNRLDHDQGR